LAIGTPPAALGDPCDTRSIARTGANGAAVRALCIAQGIPASFVDNYQFPTTATGAILSGNTALTPEAADTFNLGFVWTSSFASPWLHEASASVDYFKIDIKNVISPIPGLTGISKCYNLDGSNPSYSPANPFCALIVRDSNGNLVNVKTPYLNLGGLKTAGWSFQLNWGIGLADIGVPKLGDHIGISSTISYIGDYKVQTLPNTAFQNYAGTNTPGSSHPRWKALTTITYEISDLTAGLRWRYLDGMKDVSTVNSPSAATYGTPTYNLFDLFGSYKVSERWSLRGGVTNLLDHDIVKVSSSQNLTDPSVFDPIGRSYYIGAHLSF
jgi:outer membrane receptor protein involved in Fe transport